MNLTIWVLRVLLALAFLAAGLTKLSQPRQKLATTMGRVEDHSDPWVRAIGPLGLLGAAAAGADRGLTCHGEVARSVAGRDEVVGAIRNPR